VVSLPYVHDISHNLRILVNPYEKQNRTSFHVNFSFFFFLFAAQIYENGDYKVFFKSSSYKSTQNH